MASILDGEGEARIDRGPAIGLLDRQLGERRVVIELGKRRARLGKRALRRKHALGKLGEDGKLELKRPLGGVDDARFELGKLERREAHDIGERLPVHEGFGERRLGQGGCVGGGDLDEIAEHVVVPHLERSDAGRFRIARLQ